ncbi:MAG: sulfurtransferase complex subunit TusB [Gammaproteobacteria bacterium]|jgi:tRNA 2-thiouridine synthesizing protein B|nr:sulfurtransferase complex subunit TusB [Gammaproteobacteria bacterium]
MILHTINKSNDALHRCLSLLSDEDAVLLIEDGVYAALSCRENQKLWDTLPQVKKYAMTDDLAVRGVSDRMLPFFERVDWSGFVSLSLEYDKVVSWG